jgi:hypothetical protein
MTTQLLSVAKNENTSQIVLTDEDYELDHPFIEQIHVVTPVSGGSSSPIQIILPNDEFVIGKIVTIVAVTNPARVLNGDGALLADLSIGNSAEFIFSEDDGAAFWTSVNTIAGPTGATGAAGLAGGPGPIGPVGPATLNVQFAAGNIDLSAGGIITRYLIPFGNSTTPASATPINYPISQNSIGKDFVVFYDGPPIPPGDAFEVRVLRNGTPTSLVVNYTSISPQLLFIQNQNEPFVSGDLISVSVAGINHVLFNLSSNITFQSASSILPGGIIKFSSLIQQNGPTLYTASDSGNTVSSISSPIEYPISESIIFDRLSVNLLSTAAIPPLASIRFRLFKNNSPTPLTVIYAAGQSGLKHSVPAIENFVIGDKYSLVIQKNSLIPNTIPDQFATITVS